MDPHVSSQAPSAPVNAPQLLLNLIDRHWEIYKTERKLCREQFSSEAVRGLRIATRRMLTLVRLLRSLNLGPHLQELRFTFKGQLDSFNALRDTQVVLAEISGTVQEIPTLLPFSRYLQKREKRVLRSIKKNFTQFSPGDTARRIARGGESFEEDAIENIPVRILQTVDEAFLITGQRLQRVDPADPVTIHSVRLAFKKFRYLVEMIHPVLINFPPENLGQMKNYQGLMGRIQDLQVILQTLAEFVARTPSYDPLPALRFYEKSHTGAISIYLAGMGAINNFWRLTPDRLFPWEKVK